MKRFLRHYWAVILVCLLTVFALLPLFHPGFFPIHDDEQIGRLYDFDLAVKSGAIPPRIATNLGFGYGYPLFNFYPSFVYYLGEVFVLGGFSYILSIKVVIALGFILAAVSMYYFAREYLGEIGGIVAAVAYTYLPYHSVDVYVRGALPEFWSFVFIPAVFWALKKLADTQKLKYLLFLSFFIACLILTHNLVALMSAIFIALYGLYLLWQTKEKKQFLIAAVSAGGLGLLLSAYFWLPSYIEKKYTMIELLTTELADYRQHFVYLRQLWNSPWGYGGSLYGLYDGLSFQIGKLHILAAFAALVVAWALVLKRKKDAHITIFFLGLLLLSIFFMSFYSQFLWDSVQLLSYIQFPWRFLLFAGFTASFLVGSIFLFPLEKKRQLVLAGVIIVSLIAVNVGYFQPEKYLTSVTDESYVSHDVIRWRTSIMAFEYVPRGIATKTSDVGTTVIDISKQEIASQASQVIQGHLQVKTIIDNPQEKAFFVTADTPGVIRLNTFAFPGWTVYLNDKAIAYTDENKLKLITVFVPSGSYMLTAKFLDTPIRVLGNTLTLIGFGLFGFLSLRSFRSLHKKRK